MSESPYRVGLLGGSFNPIHNGHLFVAQQARKAFALDLVQFIPAFIAPHKVGASFLAAEHRLSMCRRAVQGDPHFGVLDVEIQRGGTSFTVDTLRHLHDDPPWSPPSTSGPTSLYFLMGSDSLADFTTWREFKSIAQLATLITIARQRGETKEALSTLQDHLDQTTVKRIEEHILEVSPHPASSTAIRELLSKGQSTRDWLPDEVEIYIRENNLYAS